MGSRNSRIAFLATKGFPEQGVKSAVQSLEEMGFEVDLLDMTAVSPSIVVHYSCVALPTVRGSGYNPLLGPLIDSMHAAGKSVMYVAIPVHGSAVPSAPAVFSFKRLFAQAWKNWNLIDAPRLGAALAYYGMLSFAPLLVLMVSITGIFFKRTIIQSGLMWQVQVFIGDAGANIVRAILENAKVSTGIVAGTIGIVVLILGASGVFLELRDSLDTVWGVTPPYGSGLWSLLRARASAFLAILGLGLILTVGFLASTVLASPARFLLRFLPTQPWVTELTTTGISLVMMSFVFALIFRAIPDIDITWQDVWIGGIVTSVLFNAGRLIIGLYLAHAAIGSAYAAAGSIIVFLTWVYYSAQIFLFGAEFTHVYALKYGSYSKAWRKRKHPDTAHAA